jgi:hypothetical protein
MKGPTLLAVIAVAALLCTLPMLAKATDSCLVALWTGPMGPENMQGQVEVPFYTIHTWLDCDCEHTPGTIYLKWRYVSQDWSDWIEMDEFLTGLCEATCYDCSFFVQHDSTIEVGTTTIRTTAT